LLRLTIVDNKVIALPFADNLLVLLVSDLLKHGIVLVVKLSVVNRSTTQQQSQNHQISPPNRQTRLFSVVLNDKNALLRGAMGCAVRIQTHRELIDALRALARRSKRL
jgi:hypothetical protein